MLWCLSVYYLVHMACSGVWLCSAHWMPWFVYVYYICLCLGASFPSVQIFGRFRAARRHGAVVVPSWSHVSEVYPDSFGADSSGSAPGLIGPIRATTCYMTYYDVLRRITTFYDVLRRITMYYDVL